MSIKKYISESLEKQKVMEEIYNILTEDDERNVRRGRREQSMETIVNLLINIGNQAYTQGDLDTFKHFISTLFELMDYELDNIKTEDLLKHVRYFVLMATHNHNIYTYSTIMEQFNQSLRKIDDSQIVNEYLQILRELALGSIRNNFELGVLEVVKTFRSINDHFSENKMHISSLYLKNLMIMLIYSAEKYQYDQLKQTIIEETVDFLKFPTSNSYTIEQPLITMDIQPQQS
jgi:hypothetical protein